MCMDTANMIACAAVVFSALSALASFCGVIVMSLQIKSNVDLKRDSKTFIKIEELDEMLYRQERLKDVIDKTRLTDDCKGHCSLSEAEKIYEEVGKEKIYEILNFFEDLSLSVFLGNINVEILRRIYSDRICNAYKKLDPFIKCIADKYEDPNKKPYQHFETLHRMLCELDGGKNGYQDSKSTFKERRRAHRIYRKYKVKL